MLRDAGRHEVYLVPGALHVSVEPCAVTTILGSCVAVCLTDVDRHIGGMNHYALPGGSADHDSLRFGAFAIGKLVELLQARGCRTESLRAKVFGGARVSNHGDSRTNHLGAQNVALARECLAAAGIVIMAEDVGGFRGRKVIYYTDEGTAWVRTL
jgi:chemotaxis protein CheD